MIVCNPSKSIQCSASAASRLKLYHGAFGRRSSAARQPAASHNTNDLRYHMADRKPEIHPPIDLLGHMEAQSKQSSHEPAASNAIFQSKRSKTFRNVLLLGSKTGQQLGSNWAAKKTLQRSKEDAASYISRRPAINLLLEAKSVVTGQI